MILQKLLHYQKGERERKVDDDRQFSKDLLKLPSNRHVLKCLFPFLRVLSVGEQVKNATVIPQHSSWRCLWNKGYYWPIIKTARELQKMMYQKLYGCMCTYGERVQRFHYILTGANDDHHHHHQTIDPIFKVRYKTDAHETRRWPFFTI